MTEETSHIAEEEVEMTSQATIASIHDSEKVSITYFNMTESNNSIHSTMYLTVLASWVGHCLAMASERSGVQPLGSTKIVVNFSFHFLLISLPFWPFIPVETPPHTSG